MITRSALLILFCGTMAVRAEVPLGSWYTARSGRYARIYQNTAAETAGTASTTWSRGQGVQTLPTYSGISEIVYSATWVYIRTTGLASHMMGPWYLDAAKTQLFPNFPANMAAIYRFPRTVNVPAVKTSTGLGAAGYFVNGVALFDMRDAFSYRNASGQDATPMNMLVGDGVWNRDGYVNEGVTFDPALAHQAGKQYHYHAQSPGLRYQLGDHVDYNPTTNRYTESAAIATKHSPIVAWAGDGLPIYGPFGYANPSDASSGVRRMISGYVMRDGQNGTTNLSTTGRHTLPPWAALVRNRPATLPANVYGPNLSATYPLGHYIEDEDYLGDLGRTQGVDFDLDQYNGRMCVTPEFPGGTYAYFETITATGAPVYPYNLGRQFYGTPAGGSVASITEAVTTFFRGGPNKTETADLPSINRTNGDVTFKWNSVEGGTYRVDASTDVVAWLPLAPSVVATNDSAQFVESGAWLAYSSRFYRSSTENSAAHSRMAAACGSSSGSNASRCFSTCVSSESGLWKLHRL